MDQVSLAVGFIQNIGFVGLLIVLAVPKLRKQIFGVTDNNTTFQHLEEYYNHNLTDFVTRISSKIEKLDKIEQHLDDMRINGVRIKG